MIIVSKEKFDITSILWINQKSTIEKEREKVESEKGMCIGEKECDDGNGLKMDYGNERIFIVAV